MMGSPRGTLRRPHPLTPSPKREGGPEAKQRRDASPKASGSPSPLGEGVGGWGRTLTDFTPSSNPHTRETRP
jgi:hypothetical protein